MKKFQTKSLFFLAFIFVLTIISCKKNEVKVEEKTAPVEVPAAPEFTPFKVIRIMHTVADYDKWRPAYDAHDSIRKSYGITHFHIGRDASNPNLVYIIDKIEDVKKAKDFAALPALKEAMKKGGVTSKPSFSYYEVIRFNDSTFTQKDRLMVTHKVKDFDAWLKAYDAEGKAKRMEEGLIDRAMSRNLDNPNIVSLTFVVTDMAKAKASISSEAKKKVMMDAGVEGKPEIVFYTLTD
jgi:quinol monooxygenase YgiN